MLEFRHLKKGGGSRVRIQLVCDLCIVSASSKKGWSATWGRGSKKRGSRGKSFIVLDLLEEIATLFSDIHRQPTKLTWPINLCCN